MSFSVADVAVLVRGLLLLAVLICRRVALLPVGELLGCTTKRPMPDRVCFLQR